jgi:hypothetical protein
MTPYSDVVSQRVGYDRIQKHRLFFRAWGHAVDESGCHTESAAMVAELICLALLEER